MQDDMFAMTFYRRSSVKLLVRVPTCSTYVYINTYNACNILRPTRIETYWLFARRDDVTWNRILGSRARYDTCYTEPCVSTLYV